MVGATLDFLSNVAFHTEVVTLRAKPHTVVAVCNNHGLVSGLVLLAHCFSLELLPFCLVLLKAGPLPWDLGLAFLTALFFSLLPTQFLQLLRSFRFFCRLLPDS